MNQKELSWSRFYSLCEDLAEKVVERLRVRDIRKDDLIELLGILRGGAVVAVTMSHIIQAKIGMDLIVSTVGVRKYPREGVPSHHPPTSEVKCYNFPPTRGKCTHSMLVDDVVVSGDTMNAVTHLLVDEKEGGGIGRLIAGRCSLFTVEGADHVDFWVKDISKDDWITFPWEVSP